MNRLLRAALLPCALTILGPLAEARAEVPSVEPRVQQVAERWLRKSAPHEGAIVMSDVRSGRVLAWASRGGGDRVSRPFAPSASVFKLITVSTLLELGRANARTKVCYSGGEGGFEEEDLREHTPGELCISLQRAVGHSINLAVAKLALKHLQPAEILTQAERLGFAGVVPIDRQVPASQLAIPSERLPFARAAAGFWNGRTSALGALFAAQTIANRGVRVRLQTHGGEVVREEDGRALSPVVAAELSRMMQTTTRSGTARAAFAPGRRAALHKMDVAGKTGTLVGDKPARMYSWFIGFAPARAPQVAIAVLLANDLTWKMKGNEVASEVLAEYFERMGRAQP